MKSKDFATIALLAGTGILLAFFVTQSIFSSYVAEETSVKTMDPITAEIIEPDPEIFNEDAINPTVEVTIEADE